MASPVGGRFKFTDGFPVHLGLKNPGQPLSSKAITGDFNIEAFTGVSTLPTLATGFQQGVLVSDTVTGDRAPEIIGSGANQILTGRRLTLFGGNYMVRDTNTVTGNTARITAGSGKQTIVGAAHDTLIGGTGTQSIVGSKGRESIVGGTGTYSVVGGAHDTVKASSNSTSVTSAHIAGGVGSMSITIGKLGQYKINSGTGDTITAVAGSAIARITSARGDRINLTGNTGRVTISGAGGDTITAGTGQETVIGKGGSMRLTLGAKGTDSVTGSTVSGHGDTIRSAQAANLIYTLGKSTTSVSGGDLLNLAGSTGTDTIIAYRDNANKQYGKVNDTIIAGNGHETIKGGPGDRIGVGNGSVVGGTLKFIHSSTLAGAVRFGTNDTVSSTTYNTTTHVATRHTVTAGTSSAHVTVTNFKVGTDSLFYKNETTARNTDIVATSHTTSGNTTFTLPDGTVMTLIGVSSIHNSFFKA